MVTLQGQHHLESPVAAVWSTLFDPAALKELIPGCQQLTVDDDGVYHGSIQIGVAAVSGTYQTTVRVAEQTPPTATRLRGEISGPTGIVSGHVDIHLEASGTGTDLLYRAEATISGALGTLNSRFAEGIASTLIRQGLARLDQMGEEKEA